MSSYFSGWMLRQQGMNTSSTNSVSARYMYIARLAVLRKSRHRSSAPIFLFVSPRRSNKRKNENDARKSFRPF